VVAQTVTPARGRQSRRITSLRLAWAREKDLVSKNKTKQKATGTQTQTCQETPLDPDSTGVCLLHPSVKPILGRTACS
jgi:hypothetical protein